MLFLLMHVTGTVVGLASIT